MSMDPILWAMKDAPIADAEEWAILVCLAERADDDGCSSFPSQATIAKRIKMADRTVRRRLEAMESRGLIGRGDQSAAAYLKDKAPVVWDLLIPLSWFPNLDRIQEFRERKGRAPLTTAERPDVCVAPDKLRRVDFGVPRPPDWGTGRTSSPGGLPDRADSGTEATGLEVQSDRTTSPTTLKELTLPNNPPPQKPPAEAGGADDGLFAAPALGPDGPSKAKRKRKPTTYVDHPRFQEFWAAYPRTEDGRKPASIKFTQVVKDGADPDVIIEGAARHRDDPNRKDQFTKHAATWLNQACWEDKVRVISPSSRPPVASSDEEFWNGPDADFGMPTNRSA